MLRDPGHSRLSNQFGYLSSLDGVSEVFSDPLPANQNETTAALTFFTSVVTTRITTHGPFSIVVRDGVTTIYRNTAPASFATPDSFRAGTPVLSANIHQQVIVDTVERTFTVVNMNTVTATARFELGGDPIRIGRRGDVFRTTLSGVLRIRDGVPPPTGHFAGSRSPSNRTSNTTDEREIPRGQQAIVSGAASGAGPALAPRLSFLQLVSSRSRR